MDETLSLFIDKIKAALGPNLIKVLLFGSRARGDNLPDSDYDLILIVNSISPDLKMIVNNIEGEMLYLHNKLFSAFLYTPDDLKRKKYHPFVRNMQRECKEL